MRRACLAVILALLAGGAQAQSSPGERQAAAQKERAALRDQIQALQRRIDETASSHKDASEALKASEQAISDISRRLAELGERHEALRDSLRDLDTAMAGQTEELARQREALAQQLRAQYASGLSPWTALLSGEDPQRIGRELAWLAYLSKARAGALAALQRTVGRLAELQAQTDESRRSLEAVLAEMAEQKKALESQQAERRQALVRIEAELRAQRGQARELQTRDERLGQVIQGLAAEIAKAEARRQAALRAEAERKAREAREAAERAREVREQAEAHRRAEQQQAEEQARRQETERQRAEQARAEQRQAEAAQGGRAAAVPAEGFAGLRKGLPYPVEGEVQGRFGAQRPDGGLWRGIVLRAPQGAAVHAVAPGRVVYAHWLPGFGNILIIDHGRQYLSVYAYNQALLRQVGDVVGRGDVVARVGATGGQVEPGLYFELRHEGAPINPQLWLGR